MNAEMRAFAEMLGKKLNKFEPDSLAGTEYTHIAEFRLSQMLGMDREDPDFQAIWDQVHDLACELIEDDPVEVRSCVEIPTEAEFAGMPAKPWRICIYDGVGRVIRNVLVDARTPEEGMRKAEAMNIPGAAGIGYTRGDDVDRLLVMDCRETWDEGVVRHLAAKLGVDYDSLPPRLADLNAE